MKRIMKRKIKYVVSIALLYVLVLSVIPVYADETDLYGAEESESDTETETESNLGATLDLSATGSISITLRDNAGVVVTDGAWTIYKVADVAWETDGLTYEYTSDFAGCGVPLDVTIDTAANAAAFAEWAEEHDISGEVQTVSKKGVVSFTGLSVGLYLLVEIEEPVGFFTSDPFLATIPMEEDGEWNYDVDAIPKTEFSIPPSFISDIILEDDPDIEPTEEIEPDTEPDPDPEPDPVPPTPTPIERVKTGDVGVWFYIILALGVACVAVALLRETLSRPRRTA